MKWTSRPFLGGLTSGREGEELVKAAADGKARPWLIIGIAIISESIYKAYNYYETYAYVYHIMSIETIGGRHPTLRKPGA